MVGKVGVSIGSHLTQDGVKAGVQSGVRMIANCHVIEDMKRLFFKNHDICVMLYLL